MPPEASWCIHATSVRCRLRRSHVASAMLGLSILTNALTALVVWHRCSHTTSFLFPSSSLVKTLALPWRLVRQRRQRVRGHRLASGRLSGFRACSAMLIGPVGVSIWLLVGWRGRAVSVGATPSRAGAPRNTPLQRRHIPGLLVQSLSLVK
jgi:hypothetical protein